MAQDRSRHDAAGERRAKPSETGDKQKDGRDEFDDSAPDPAERFRSHLGENVNGLLGSGELEEQCLHKDDGREAPTDLIDGFHDFPHAETGMLRIRRGNRRFLTDGYGNFRGNEFDVAIPSPDPQDPSR